LYFSRKSKVKESMTLNRYLYDAPAVVERLIQGQKTTVREYRNQATGCIMEFERAFAENGVERTKYQARM
jgi:hypothetical protein